MSDIVREKQFPSNYPDDAVRILNAMSFTDGENVSLLGSSSLRSQLYSADFDGFEMVHIKGSATTAARELSLKFKAIIRRLLKIPNVFIGDIKCGVVAEWRIVPKTKWDSALSRQTIMRLYQENILTKNEADEALEVIKNGRSKIGKLLAKDVLKYHIVRWTPAEILKGSKTLRDGRKYTLEEALLSPAITKLDVIGLIENNRYTEFSMIYSFVVSGVPLNPEEINIKKELEDSVSLYRHKGDLFKVLKRKFALAKLEGNTKRLKKLQPILNGDLGRIYQILSEIGSLIDLLERHKTIAPIATIRYEIDQLKGKMALIYANSHYLKKETHLLNELNALLEAPKSNLLPLLEKFYDEFSKILNEETPRRL